VKNRTTTTAEPKYKTPEAIAAAKEAQTEAGRVVAAQELKDFHLLNALAESFPKTKETVKVGSFTRKQPIVQQVGGKVEPVEIPFEQQDLPTIVKRGITDKPLVVPTVTEPGKVVPGAQATSIEDMWRLREKRPSPKDQTPLQSALEETLSAKKGGMDRWLADHGFTRADITEENLKALLERRFPKKSVKFGLAPEPGKFNDVAQEVETDYPAAVNQPVRERTSTKPLPGEPATETPDAVRLRRTAGPTPAQTFRVGQTKAPRQLGEFWPESILIQGGERLRRFVGKVRQKMAAFPAEQPTLRGKKSGNRDAAHLFAPKDAEDNSHIEFYQHLKKLAGKWRQGVEELHGILTNRLDRGWYPDKEADLDPALVERFGKERAQFANVVEKLLSTQAKGVNIRRRMQGGFAGESEAIGAFTQRKREIYRELLDENAAKPPKEQQSLDALETAAAKQAALEVGLPGTTAADEEVPTMEDSKVSRASTYGEGPETRLGRSAVEEVNIGNKKRTAEDRTLFSYMLDKIGLDEHTREVLERSFAGDVPEEIADWMRIPYEQVLALRSEGLQRIHGSFDKLSEAEINGSLKPFVEDLVNKTRAIPTLFEYDANGNRVVKNKPEDYKVEILDRLDEIMNQNGTPKEKTQAMKDFARELGFRPEGRIFSRRGADEVATAIKHQLFPKKPKEPFNPPKASDKSTEKLLHGSLVPELDVVPKARQIIGAIRDRIRKTIRSAETPAQIEAVATEARDMVEPMRANPATSEIKASYRHVTEQGPVPPSKPHLRKGDRQKGIVQKNINTLRMLDPEDQELMKIAQDMASVAEHDPDSFMDLNERVDNLIRAKGIDAVLSDEFDKILKGYHSIEGAEAVRRKHLEQLRLFKEASDLQLQAMQTNDVNLIREMTERRHDALMKYTLLERMRDLGSKHFGRGLAFLRKIPGTKVEDLEGKLRTALRSDFTVNQAMVDDIMQHYKSFMQLNTPESAQAFKKALKVATNPTKWDMFAEAYKAALIGPAAHIANLTGNTTQVAVNTLLHQTLTPAIDKAIAEFTGARSTYQVPHSMLTETMGHSIKQAMPELVQGITDAILAREPNLTRAQLMQSNVASEMANYIYSGANPNPIIGGHQINIGEFLRTQLKLLGVGDAFFKHIVLGREMLQSAYAKAMRELGPTASDAAVHQRTSEIAKQLDEWRTGLLDYKKLQAMHGDSTAKLMRNEYLKTIERIHENIQREVFQENLPEWALSLNKNVRSGPIMKYPGTFVFPFWQTPINVGIEALRYTPFNAIKQGMKLKQLITELHDMQAAQVAGTHHPLIGDAEGIAARQREIAHGIAKSAFGTAVMGSLYFLANTGALTGGGPVDPREEMLLRQTGWQPYSLKVGDQYVSYQRIEPFSSLFGFASDMSEAVKHGDFKKASTAAERMTGSMAENLTNKTFLSGLEGLFTMFHDPKQYMGRFVKQMSGSLVPNMVGPVPAGSLGRAWDPYYRQTEAFTAEPMMAKIPGLQERLLKQAGPTGEYRKKPGANVVERLISPFSRTQEDTGPAGVAAKVLLAADYPPSLPRRSMNIGGKDIDLTREEYKILQEAQQKAGEHVARIAKDPTFLRLPDTEDEANGKKSKRDVLERIYRTYRTQANKRVRAMIMARKGYRPNGYQQPSL
jgi:hypothetical protein